MFTEVCRDHVRSKKINDDNENAKRTQNSFVLKDAIESELKQMEADRENNENNIPKNFPEFVMKKEFYNFLQALLEYCRVSICNCAREFKF